nr:uncharacterized protein LOC129444049 [Misgurnus anguillicaudatus]XP_055060370.1 uncharacterized protein LOC129444049 [Misgurnus anguillicaudatus]XP_055060371.1 uncharacterized protein LOC129444049 [Misgurnus anguillicaudatus]XP_055060372.1 uncharacterized protein LOC129444049 [Misgurnus anguillicaudatus]
MVRTLNELSQLKDNRFGQPDPRHGLRLLWWFANECVSIDSYGRMTAQCNPTTRVFGFKRFSNRIEDDEDRLLPNNVTLPYYEVGNLNDSGSLPSYVTVNHNRNRADSNKDRIIVRYNSGLRSFDRIYVTQHADHVNFDQNHTYRISQGLIKTIQGFWNLEEFLRQTKNAGPPEFIFQPQSHLQAQYAYQPMETRSIVQPTPYQYQPYNRPDDSACLYIFLLICVVIGCLLLLFLAANFKR